jgi:hypothetical protein
MADRTYWLDLFTPTTWQEFLSAGATVSGFRESRWNTLQKVRPTFSRLDPRLAEICRYISFEALRERLAQLKDVVRYLKPDFLEAPSEECDLEQE